MRVLLSVTFFHIHRFSLFSEADFETALVDRMMSGLIPNTQACTGALVTSSRFVPQMRLDPLLFYKDWKRKVEADLPEFVETFRAKLERPEWSYFTMKVFHGNSASCFYDPQSPDNQGHAPATDDQVHCITPYITTAHAVKVLQRYEVIS